MKQLSWASGFLSSSFWMLKSFQNPDKDESGFWTNPYFGRPDFGHSLYNQHWSIRFGGSIKGAFINDVMKIEVSHFCGICLLWKWRYYAHFSATDGEEGSENLQICVTSFMDGPLTLYFYCVIIFGSPALVLGSKLHNKAL